MAFVIEEKDLQRFNQIHKNAKLANENDIPLLTNLLVCEDDGIADAAYSTIRRSENNIIFGVLDKLSDYSDDTLLYDIDIERYKTLTENQLDIIVKFLSGETQLHSFIQYMIEENIDNVIRMLKNKLPDMYELAIKF